MMSRIRVMATLLVLIQFVPGWTHGASAAPADGDQYGTNFNESWGCGNGISGPRPPLADKVGIPYANQRIYGPWADMFGRNYYQILAATNPWVVPMSGGQTVHIHDRARPAYDAVAANLQAEFASGNFYASDSAGGFTWRTVGGKRNLSYHAFGLALDINSSTNPYRDDNVLITDMPVWYRDAWRTEGFCWGGDWVDVKDTMHYSWMGPVASSFPTRPTPFPPLNAPSTFGQIAVASTLEPRMTTPSDGSVAFSDLSGDGAPDLVSLYPSDGTYFLQVAGADSDFTKIGIYRDTTIPVSANQRVFFADHELTSYPEIWVADVSGSTLVLDIYALDGTPITSYPTTISVDTSTDVSVGYFDSDWEIDLLVVQPGAVTSLQVWDGASNFAIPSLSTEAEIGDTTSPGWSFSIGDRDIDGISDVYAFERGSPTTVHVFDGAEALNPSSFVAGFNSDVSSRLAVGDYDGDGYDDIARLEGTLLRVHLGGVRGPAEDLSRWFKGDGADPWDALGPYDLGPFLTAEEFVRQQYRDFLGREGETAGVAFWADHLVSGRMSPEQVIDDFMGSAEFGQRIAPVVRLYSATFLRLPDYDGLLTWANASRSGWTLEQIADEFTTSAEFQNRYGDVSDAEFVTLLYNNVLGRDPDAGGLADWVGRLESGQSRGSILVGFSESVEYRAAYEHEVVVTMAYVGMVRRAPEPGGFEFWVDKMDTGMTRISMMGGFFRSIEYANRF